MTSRYQDSACRRPTRRPARPPIAVGEDRTPPCDASLKRCSTASTSTWRTNLAKRSRCAQSRTRGLLMWRQASFALYYTWPGGKRSKKVNCAPGVARASPAEIFELSLASVDRPPASLNNDQRKYERLDLRKKGLERSSVPSKRPTKDQEKARRCSGIGPCRPLSNLRPTFDHLLTDV